MSPAPLLILGYGNPSRGDDALGPLFIEEITALTEASRVETLTDFQLQIEHAVDLEKRTLVLFVDASESARPPFEFSCLTPQQDQSYSSHALSPAAVLAVYQQIHNRLPPPSFLLAIPGYQFELGAALSTQAADHLREALQFGRQLVGQPDAGVWRSLSETSTSTAEKQTRNHA